MNDYYDKTTIVLAVFASVVIALMLMAQACSQKAHEIREFNQIMDNYQ